MNPFHAEESLNAFFIDQVKGYAIFATDPNGIILTWNKGAERLKGYTEKEIIGQYYGILHPDEMQQAGYPARELKIATEQGIYKTEDWRKRKDGSLFWATIILTPIFSNEGEHLGFTKVTGDISKQKELQDKLAERQQGAFEKKNDALQKTNLDLDNFIYTVSHDLRAPIINIEALMGYLKEELIAAHCLNAETKDLLKRVTNSVTRFKKTIEDLTEISKVHKDTHEAMSEEIINIKEVYDDIILDLNYLDNLKTCFIRNDFKVYQIKFSKKNFRSILYNLLSNAVKYRSPGRSCVVHIQTRLQEPYVILSVEDNGLGMNARNQQQLFTMFKRFHNHVEGTGVGLYMVKRIIENAGGKIEVESKEGVGTTFKIYLKADM
jgi:PAS domain S-box-containing protein